MNFYLYVDNMPTAMTDPLGLEKKTKMDLLNCAIFPLGCGVVQLCKFKALAAAKKKFNGELSDGTPSNAYLHCYWSCCIVAHRGRREAVYERS